MDCCSHCMDAGSLFSQRLAQRELRRYRRNGPSPTTRLLLSAIGPAQTHGMTLLDIGSGIGAIPHELLASGLVRATVVEAAAAYLEASKTEAARRGERERLTYFHGDFVDIAAKVDSADIVTLDRVICCYPDVEKLVVASVSKAKDVYGLVYPRERGLTRTGARLVNLFLRLRGRAFRTYIHSSAAVEAIILRNGFRRSSYDRTFLWQVLTYVRTMPEPS